MMQTTGDGVDFYAEDGLTYILRCRSCGKQWTDTDGIFHTCPRCDFNEKKTQAMLHTLNAQLHEQQMKLKQEIQMNAMRSILNINIQDKCAGCTWMFNGYCHSDKCFRDTLREHGVCYVPQNTVCEFDKTYLFQKQRKKRDGRLEAIKERLNNLTDADRKKLIDGVIIIICAILYMIFANKLPEWISNLCLVGLAVLSYCVNKVALLQS